MIDAGEVCDDGNVEDGDGCSADCGSEELCGNGIVDVVLGEQCDDGNAVNGDGCCTTICTIGPARVRQRRARRHGEQSATTATSSGDGCSADCASSEACGNGIVDVNLGEQCDDGNVIDTDGCHNDCTLP